jgi:hypothetical protein
MHPHSPRDPGDVVIGSLGLTPKVRPWLVLWVDDVAGTACVVGLTTQAQHVGAIKTGHPRYRHVAALVAVVGLENTGMPEPAGHFDQQQRKRVTKALKKRLDL